MQQKERNKNATKSKFVGVRQRPSGKWVAEIKNTTQKIRMWLGTFDTAEEAARAYDEAACLLRGSNTRTNFVNHVPSNSALSLKIRNILNQKKGLTQASSTTKTISHPSSYSGLEKDIDDGYKPDLSNCIESFGMSPFHGDHLSALASASEIQIQDFERMKVERQISASLYDMNGVNEYWENVHDSSDALWDLPMLCQLFCLS